MDKSEEIVDNPDAWVAEHIREYFATDGRRGHRLSGWKASTLLLATRGRRLGKLRRTSPAYGEHDGRYIGVASNGGARRHPDWYLNLVEDPAVQLQVRDDRFAARACDARTDERAAPPRFCKSIAAARGRPGLWWSPGFCFAWDRHAARGVVRATRRGAVQFVGACC